MTKTDLSNTIGSESTPVLRAVGIRKTYRMGKVKVPVLKGVSLDVSLGEWLTILGASGSGKSTLLHLLGGLDKPDRRDGGRIEFRGTSLASMPERDRNAFRSGSVGFVFQFYHLLPELSVVENVLLASRVKAGPVSGVPSATRDRARLLLDRFGLGHRLRHKPSQLSGGERQRVAIARALVNEPAVLLADEPTGNLDQKTGSEIIGVLEELRASTGQTLVMVTHDASIAARADRVVRLVDGLVADQVAEGSDQPVQSGPRSAVTGPNADPQQALGSA